MPGKGIQVHLPGKEFFMSHGHCNHPGLSVSWLPDQMEQSGGLAEEKKCCTSGSLFVHCWQWTW